MAEPRSIGSNEPTRAMPPASGREETTPLPEIGEQSVVLSLDPEGRLGAGIQLNDLEGEARVPELAMGAEKYRILGVLGQGGMGKVYLAYDRDLRRRVALKMVKAEASATTLARFLEEAQLMGQLEHPSIIPVHEVGLTKGRKLYYTMPVVRGRTLRDVLEGLRAGDAKVRAEWSLARRIQMMVQVAQAVSYAHAKGVVHRDLKPANVMVGAHGEVQVMDWGLSKVFEERGLEVIADEGHTKEGHAVGTPWYMSPEQALGEPVDGASDVWSLGVILYEHLTLERPFEGAALDVLAAIRRDEPEPPRSRELGREIPLALEERCLAALRKEPGERPTAEALAAGLQEWTEAEADREKRHQLAEAKAAEGKVKLAEYVRLKDVVKRLEAEAEEVSRRFEPWQPRTEKAALFAAQARVTAERDKLVRVASDVVTTLAKALGFEEGNGSAREALAEYYWDRFVEAERRNVTEDRKFFGALVQEYHGGKYERELRGDGTLELTSEPSGAEVWLMRQEEDGPVLVDGEARRLGTTPLAATPLPMGSYVVALKREGYREQRYPVHITRNREWKGSVRLCTDEEAGTGFVLVPGGPCALGGDEEVFLGLPQKEVEVGDFFLAEHPVTMSEYLEYLNEVARGEGLEAAKLKSPRRVADTAASSYLLEDGKGGLKLPELDVEGDRWEPRIPALGISVHDAVGYCRWRSERDGTEYRLPSEEEWEKAARGVDGRWYPWGWGFDPSLCNMRESRKERPSPVAVEECPEDRSVYGVRGLGGNVRDWTSSELVEGTGESRRVQAVSRGGSWAFAARDARAARRYGYGLANVYDVVGFRLARSRG